MRPTMASMCRSPSRYTRRACFLFWRPRLKQVARKDAKERMREREQGARMNATVTAYYLLCEQGPVQGSKFKVPGSQKRRTLNLEHETALGARIKRIHHQAFMVPGRAEILIQRVCEHAVRHHRV